jgi:putative addiction module killer protein
VSPAGEPEQEACGDAFVHRVDSMWEDYRIYFTIRDEALIVLLAGGDKSSQSADIRRAQKLGKRLEHE